MNEPVPLEPALRNALLEASTATITTRLFDLGLRNCYLQGPRWLNPSGARLVGEAFTLRYIPAREDLDVLDIFDDPGHPQRLAVETVRPGAVLVIDSRGKRRAASIGHILATRLQCRGVAGLVTDGAVRDLDGIVGLDMPVFAAGASATTNLGLHHAVDMQVPIACGDVPVYPGDVIVGDMDGVVCIPRELAESIAYASRDQERLERFLLQQIESGKPLKGTYPPGPETIALYEALQNEGEE